MNRRHACLLAALLFFIRTLPAQLTPTAQIGNAGFEEGLAHWKIVGQASADESNPVQGKKALRIERDPVHLPLTIVASESFPIPAGVWTLSGAIEHDLYSPDLSFNVSITVRMYDKAGKEMKQKRLLSASAKSGWTKFQERFDVPRDAVTAAVFVDYNKTHGWFRLDDLALQFAGKAVPMEGGDRRVIFKSNRVGHLFYPGDDVLMELVVETPEKLSGSQLNAAWELTDFGRVRLAPPETVALTPDGTAESGWNRYRGRLDLRNLPLKTGPYYEIQTTLRLGAESPARDTASFAILPEPVTLGFDPLESPFGAHTWDARVYEYFPLAARLGLRRCLVFWSWPSKAPYEPNYKGGGYDSRLGWPKRFGLAPYGVLYPVMNIEHKDGDDYSEEALREGIRQSIEKYGKDGLWGFQIGNEPPSWNPDMVKRDVETYRIVYEAIKKTDPKIVAIGSAIGASETFFKAGFQNWQDAYNIHGYSDLGELRSAMRHYHELFKKYGGEKPIWSTEIGSKSQGLPRDVIAADIIRKSICFFADGGGFLTWFAVGGMPDPKGERTGTYTDSMDLFASRYNMHLPRLDAVAFYHLINILSVKKFVSTAAYPDGLEAFLFRDKQDNAVVIAWNMQRSSDVFLPLPGVHETAVTQMDGNSSRLDAGGKGLNLRISENPVFITFRGGPSSFPASLNPSALQVESLPGALTQGESKKVTFLTARDASQTLTLSGPPSWKITGPETASLTDGSKQLSWQIEAPADTTARVAYFKLSDGTFTAQGDTELVFKLPVKSRVSVDLLPEPAQTPGQAELTLVLTNDSSAPQKLGWKAELVSELAMENGSYNLAEARPARAYFDSVARNSVTLNPKETRRIKLALKGVDRLSIYKVRATASDSTGNEVTRERLAGGFARVVRFNGQPIAEGRLDENAWSQAPVLDISEARQMFYPEKDAKRWVGPADLSGQARMMWDDRYLYIRMEVVDDVYCNPGSGYSMWNQDGIQFLIDPFRQEVESRGRYDYSMGLGQKGVEIFRHMTADPSLKIGLSPEIKLTVSDHGTGGGKIYEVAFPWHSLAPFQPKAGANLGLAVIINEDDGPGRKSFMGWFSGVHLKEALFVGDLILDK
ncbi:MAG TPA: sugar-binding protein [Chthoniobacterales bacterium]